MTEYDLRIFMLKKAFDKYIKPLGFNNIQDYNDVEQAKRMLLDENFSM